MTYIDGIKFQNESTTLEKGTYLHLILEKYNEIKSSNFSKYPDFNFELSNEEDINSYNKIALNFITSDIGKYYLEDIEVIGEEIEFGLDSKLIPINYNSEKAILRGKIDKIIKKENNYIIVDWKSGKFPDQQYHDNSQGILYALWFFRNYKDIDEVKMTFVYIEHNQEYFFNFKRQYLQNYATMYSNKIINIEKCEDFVKNESKLCNYCIFRTKEICL